MRWTDPVHGQISPQQFIPVLEQTGLIAEAGAWALREACRQGLQWIVAAAPSLVLSVNVSPRQFAANDFLPRLEEVLADTGFSATRLQLEVTEGLLLEPTPETLRKLTERLGIAQTSKALRFCLFGGLGATHINASANGMSVASVEG